MISSLNLDTNFLGVKLIPSSLESDENAFLQFMYPTAPASYKDSSFEEVTLRFFLILMYLSYAGYA